jgi:negative regulator of sigma E activity
MQYSPDELEFAISQYIDGTLKPLEQAALEEVLATDDSARAMLAEYRKLDASLKRELPTPQIDHNLLGARISGALKGVDAPVHTYRLFASMPMKLVAMAAAILIVVGLVIPMMNRSHSGQTHNTIAVIPNNTNQAAPIVELAGIDHSSNSASVDIAVGAPPGFASAGFSEQAVISRPPQLVIESSALPAQDSATPY